MTRTAPALLGRSYLTTDRRFRLTEILRREGPSWLDHAVGVALDLHRRDHDAVAEGGGMELAIPVAYRNKVDVTFEDGWTHYNVSVGFEHDGPTGAIVVSLRGDGSWWLREFGGRW